MRIQRSDSYLKERNMMTNQSGGNNLGQRTTQSRRLLRFALAMAFSIWLLFQINHEFNSQRHRQNEENTSIQDSGPLLLSRKVNLGEGLIGEESVGFALIVERTGDREVRDGGAVTYEGNVFEDENGVPPDLNGVYLTKPEDDNPNASAGLGTL